MITGVSRKSWPIIIGGCPRSGTSLVRRILNAHSRIYSGPEVKFFRDFSGDYPNDPLRHQEPRERPRFTSSVSGDGGTSSRPQRQRRSFGRAGHSGGGLTPTGFTAEAFYDPRSGNPRSGLRHQKRRAPR
ncbi:MAG: sulfotransferase [Armatimonadetes bacterium]|nr:sulfotransferase [Armatimonadota bacterium]